MTVKQDEGVDSNGETEPNDLTESNDAYTNAAVPPHPSGGGAAGGGYFPPIADYAFLSDCETNVLIAPSGAVEWMCVPRPDSPSVFSAILDRAAGSFRVGPHGVR